MTVLISSCQSNLNQPGYNGFRCSFGNQEYIADTAFYIRSPGAAGSTTIHAQTNGKDRFVFYLEGYKADTIGTTALDTFVPGSPITISPGYYFDQNNVQYKAVNGSVTISQYYNDSLSKISGSFSFTGLAPTNSLYFSYGYFNNIPRH